MPPNILPTRPLPPDSEFAAIAAELAGLRFQLALIQCDRELKYRKDQARLPKGGQGGGQFADEGRGTSHRAGSGVAETARRAAGKVAA